MQCKWKEVQGKKKQGCRRTQEFGKKDNCTRNKNRVRKSKMLNLNVSNTLSYWMKLSIKGESDRKQRPENTQEKNKKTNTKNPTSVYLQTGIRLGGAIFLNPPILLKKV